MIFIGYLFMSTSINIIVSGAHGYAGQELIRLITHHPFLHLLGIHSRDASMEITCFKSIGKPIRNYSLEDIFYEAHQIDLLVLATPAEVSMKMVAALIETEIAILDLSGAFRLPEQTFMDWYGMPHTISHLIQNAHYGLSPWVIPAQHTKLIANPGCYATCALMTLIPLLKANLIKTESIIIDAKSGVSGAGKQAKPALMFTEISNNFFPYKLGKHQHTPEICHQLEAICGTSIQLRFSTAMLPIIRGISMTIYTNFAVSDASDPWLSKAVQDAFDEAYANYPLIQHAEVGQNNPSTDDFILNLKNVVQTPYTHIGYHIHQGQLTLYSCIDNLLKGAASQAIETMNTMLQLPIQTGLLASKEDL